MVVFLDSSYLLALYNESDVHHAQALKLAEELAAGRHGQPFTSDHVFDETVSVALRKFGKEKAQLLGRQVLASISILVADYHVLDSAWRIFTKTKLALSFTDCTNLVFMQLADTPVIATFDKEFAKVSGIEVLS